MYVLTNTDPCSFALTSVQFSASFSSVSFSTLVDNWDPCVTRIEESAAHNSRCTAGVCFQTTAIFHQVTSTVTKRCLWHFAAPLHLHKYLENGTVRLLNVSICAYAGTYFRLRQ